MKRKQFIPIVSIYLSSIYSVFLCSYSYVRHSSGAHLVPTRRDANINNHIKLHDYDVA